jgi:MSHA biogenesis protein MshO
MSSHRPSDTLHRGFTLVELVICIVLAAIVAAFMVLFLDSPVQSYFQQTRRADLIDSADRIANAVTDDVRTALPNSLRTAIAGNKQALEFLQTEGVARYYGAGDKGGTSPNAELQTGLPPVSDNAFGTLDGFDDTRTAAYTASYLSVGNLGTPGHDAYSNGGLTGTMTPAMVISVDPAPVAPPFVPGENQVTLSRAMSFVPDGLPAQVHNAYFVTGPVSYVCNPNPANPKAGTLKRYSNYAVRAAPRVPPVGATISIVAHDVAACSMSYFQDKPGPTTLGYRFGEIAILEVTLSSGGESFQVFVEAPTEYSR